MNLQKFLKKKSAPEEGSAPEAVSSDPAKETEEEAVKQQEEALQQVVKEEQKKPVMAIKPLTERITRVNKAILVGGIVIVVGALGWLLMPSKNSGQKDVKAPEVHTNVAAQNNALSKLQDAEAEKGGQARQKALENGKPVKEGEVRSSVPSRQEQQKERAQNTRSAGKTEMTAEEREAAEERKIERTRERKAVDLRLAEDRAGERSDIFFNIGEKSKAKDLSNPTVNDYYNDSYTPPEDEGYVQVIESGNGRSARRG